MEPQVILTLKISISFSLRFFSRGTGYMDILACEKITVSVILSWILDLFCIKQMTGQVEFFFLLYEFALYEILKSMY